MPRWRILADPTKKTSDPDFDFWVATLENIKDPTQRRLIGVEIPRTVRDSDVTQLLQPIQNAVVTNGKSAIERYLDMPKPPVCVVVGSTAILPRVEQTN